MLCIEEILKISNEMGIEIRDSTDGKHYILDEYGKEVEFSTNMLIKVDEKNTSHKMQIQVSEDFNYGKFSSSYNLADCNSLYVAESVSIGETIIDAA
ncbi:hypothetical protein KQI41_16835 [Tissierella pigra]|uniref:Uncharacterized protein n=1 Tax=Tissierella pigra TaxID=2607614 RepID=A0A6N7XYZ9_9FIRM|nr:hypothetical protein [Tissierella pigra]MBU5428060.1 hypothetical protein [Tissierella pigra]MSU02683.1 hypothetical protein [Tissierella pigra]